MDETSGKTEAADGPHRRRGLWSRLVGAYVRLVGEPRPAAETASYTVHTREWPTVTSDMTLSEVEQALSRIGGRDAGAGGPDTGPRS
jgi:hypothetical protein